MRNRFLFLTGLSLLLCTGFTQSFAQDASRRVPWTPDQVVEPAELAARINTDTALLILNTGPVDDIRNAVNIGAVQEKKNLRKMKQMLRKVPRDKEIVFYCGCCAMATCPNILPAYNLLREMGFTNFKILDIKETLAEDWMSKGYPMAAQTGGGQ